MDKSSIRSYRFVILAVSLLMVVSSCSKRISPNSDVATIRIPVERTDKPETFNDYFSLGHYVVLETSDSSLIGRIDKVTLMADKIYIMDRRQRKIFIFNGDGKLIHQFCKHGQSSREYINLDDFCLRGDTLYVLDGYYGKLLAFDLTREDEFLSSINIEPAQGIYVWDESKISLYIGTGYAVGEIPDECYSYAFYEDGAIRQKAAPFNKQLRGRHFSQSEGDNQTYSYKDSLFMIFPFNDTIYHISGGGAIRPYLRTDAGMEKMDYDNANFTKKIYSDDVFKGIFSFYKLGGYTLFAYYYKQLPKKYTLLDSCGEIVFNGHFGLDANSLPVHILPYNGSPVPNCLLSVTYPSEILTLQKQKNFQTGIVKEIADKINEEGNPILVFYNLKE